MRANLNINSGQWCNGGFCRAFIFLLIATLSFEAISFEVAAVPLTPSVDEFFPEIPVVVSATRLRQSVHDAPASVTTLDRDILETVGVTELVDLLRLVPGFQVSHAFGNTFAVTYHGFTFDFSRKLQIMVDGRPVYRPMLSSTDWANLGLSVSDIERIEIIRGSNIPTWGENAFAGTVNIVTRSEFMDNGLHAETTTGGNHLQEHYLRYSGGSRSFDYRLILGYRRDDGFEAQDDGRDIWQMNWRAGYNISSRDTLHMDLGISSGKMGAWGEDKNPLNPIRDRSVDSYHVMMRWERKINTANKIRFQIYQNRDISRDEFIIGTIDDLFPGIPLVGDLVVKGGIVDGDAQRSELEFQQISEPVTGLRLVWGGALREDVVQSEVAFDQKAPHKDQSSRLFANSEWRMGRRWLLNLGYSHDRNSLVGDRNSPRLGVNYAIADGHTIRTAYTRAYRSPSLWEAKHNWVNRATTGELIQIQFVSDGKNLVNERIIVSEFAYLYTSKIWQLEIKGFREKFDDIITGPGDKLLEEPFVQNGARRWTNSAEAVVYGSEAQIRLSLARHQFLALNMSRLRASGRQVEEFSGPDVRYSSLADNVPRNTISAVYGNRFTNGWGIGLTHLQMSDLEWNGAGDFIQGYKRWDLTLSRTIKRRRWQATAAVLVQNLLNDIYQENKEVNEFKRRVFVNLKIQFK